jgi:hypothetical protein
MVVLVGISLLGILLWMIPAIKLGLSSVPEDEKLLATSVSPNNAYKLQAYRTEPGATVDFSVKVYIVTKKEKILIYNAYHETDVHMEWINNSEVSINGRTLDLSKGDTYDWRKS